MSNIYIRKGLRWLGFIILGLVALVVIAVAALSLWLSPSRLGEIINREGSRFLGAEIRVSNPRYTLFSSFPELRVSFDSLSITAPGFDSLPDSTASRLPSDPGRLLSAGSTSASLDLIPLLHGAISLGEIHVDNLRASIVQVNDSLDNFSFFPKGKSSSIPQISLKGNILAENGRVSYLSLPLSTDASARIDTLRITPAPENSPLDINSGSDGGSYHIRLIGEAAASSGGTVIANALPLGVDGDVKLRLNPFGISTSGLGLDVARAHANLDLDADIEKSIRLNRLRLGTDPFPILSTLSYIPAAAFTLPDGVEADPLLQLTAALSEPFLPADSLLPSGSVEFAIPDGSIVYPAADGTPLTINHHGIAGTLLVDGHNPGAMRLSLPGASFSGEGIDLTLALEALDLLGNPSVSTDIEGTTDLRYLGTPLASALRNLSPKGRADLATSLSFNLDDAKNLRLDRMKASGKAAVKNLSLSNVTPGLDLKAGNAQLLFDGTSSLLSSDSLGSSLLNFDFSGRDLRIAAKGMKVDVGSLTVGSDASGRGALGKQMARAARHIPVNLDVKAADVAFSMPADSLKGSVGALSADASLRHDFKAGLSDLIQGDFRVAAVSLLSGRTRVNLDSVITDLSLSRRTKPMPLPDYKVPEKWKADKATLAIANHYPEYLTLKAPESVKRLMSLWNGAMGMVLTGADFTAPVFPVNTRIDRMELVASPDSVDLLDFYLRTVDTGLRLRGGVSNLRQFLTSRTPAPLNLDLTATLDTIMLDHLAAAYERGLILTKGPDAAKMHPKSFYATPRDSITILLPRNINARIHASAKESKYLGLDLYNYLIDATLADGILDVSHINVDSGFGDGAFAVSYDSSNANDLTFGLKADLDSVNIVKFFSNFHTLMLMMPAVRNLAGTVGIQTDMSVGLFPDMYLNFPSIIGQLDLSGRDLLIHQTKNVHRYTRFMLLPDSTLQIPQLDIKAVFHDNIYELYPMEFDMSRYHLGLAGLGSYNGRFYFHVGLFKSPFHLPFGVNVKGTFKHPEIRFGSADWHPSNAREVTAAASGFPRVNVIGEGKYIIREMIHKAAEADSLPPSAFTF